MSYVIILYSIVFPQTEDVEDSIDETWIVSGQSSAQEELIENLMQERPLFVEGSFRVWLRAQSVNYFILRADPDPTPKSEIDPDGKFFLIH